MWPDNPGFPIPSVLVEGISLRESHRCLGSRSSWKTDPYVARNPVDLKELGFGIHSAPFQSLCMANSLWPGNIRENVALVRRPARIKIENKRRCYDFLHAGYLQNSGPWMRDHRPADEIIHQETRCWQVWCGLIHFWTPPPSPLPPSSPLRAQGVQNASDHLKLRWAGAEECGPGLVVKLLQVMGGRLSL